jgi:Lrp/AsnC family transcriptional regulator for asnA, asnC and gidA
MDDCDRRIVSSLRAGGRRSNADIAREVGVSEATVRRRIAALEDMGALQFVVMTNPHALGLHTETLMTISADVDKVQAVAAELSKLPEVRFVGIAMGDYDIVVSALFPSVEAWLEFRTARLAHMDGIRTIRTFQIAKVLKRTYDLLIHHRNGEAGDQLTF